MHAQTIRDHEQWSAFFSKEGQVDFVYTNGNTASGTWSADGNSVFIRFAGPAICKHVYIDSANLVHWKDCGDDATTSYIISMSNGNTTNSNGNSQAIGPKQALMLSIVRQFLGGMVNNVPNNVPVKPFFNNLMYDLIDPEIASHLNEDDKRLAVQAIIAGLQTGQDQEWSNPDTRRSGDIKTLRSYRDDSGRLCREYETQAWLEDGTQYAKRRNACFNVADNAWVPIG